MAQGRPPYATVLASTAFYAVLLRLCQQQKWSDRASIKLLSSLHSACMTAATIAVLNMSWDMPLAQEAARRRPRKDSPYLDDSSNPVIVGHLEASNMLTSWETGYLLYDTCAMLVEAHRRKPGSGIVRSVSELARSSPVFLAHHIALLTGLGILQTYIAAGRERGMWVIMALFLMNASNPLLHLRWWQKKRTGKTDIRADLLLAAVFAVSRFGTVGWILSKYGSHHRLGPWESFRKQRSVCQAGTGLLTGLNAVWWVLLLKGIARKTVAKAI